MQDRAVVVGASLAGLRAAESMRRAGHEGPLTIVGAERHRPYDRPPLSKQVLEGKVGPDDIFLRVEDGLDAEWMLGTRATGLDLAARGVRLDQGDDLHFDRLVITTGAEPRVMRGAERSPRVHYLRTLDDAVSLRDALSDAGRVVVIGAGFIGLEVAATAHQLGVEVTVLEALPIPLVQAIGPEMGLVVAELQRRHGVDIRLGVAVRDLVDGDQGLAVRLEDGSALDCDLVVVGIGVVPNVSWLDGSGVHLSNGVLCDERLRVIVHGRPSPDIVAAGDVARWPHPAHRSPIRIEHWTNAAEQGDAAGVTVIRGDEAPPYAEVPYFWSDQHGLKLQFIGSTEADDEVEVLEGDPAEDRFVAAYGRRGHLVAAFGVRRPARVTALLRMIRDGAPFPPAFGA